MGGSRYNRIRLKPTLMQRIMDVIRRRGAD